uniref:DNA topoisomerase n=1 Tax=Pseudomonas phage HRDY3 TaxID=3236930 RepID=A0AB39CDN2_9VIRU
MSVQSGIKARVTKGLREVSPTCGDCSGLHEDVLVEGNNVPCGKIAKGNLTKKGTDEKGNVSAKEAIKNREPKHEASAICPKFSPNTRPVGELGSDKISELAELISSIDPKAMRALSVLLHNEPVTRGHGMTFMQKVYVRYRGAANRNYISNFMQAYVMYATSQHYKLMSADGRCVLTYGAHCRPVIHTEQEFQGMYENMLAKNALVDPDAATLISRRWRHEEEFNLGISDLADKVAKEGIGVSTIDDVFTSNNIRKGRKKGLPDLISLVEDAAAGYDVDNKASNFVERDVKRDRGSDEEEESAPKKKRGSAVKVRNVREGAE